MTIYNSTIKKFLEYFIYILSIFFTCFYVINLNYYSKTHIFSCCDTENHFVDNNNTNNDLMLQHNTHPPIYYL